MQSDGVEQVGKPELEDLLGYTKPRSLWKIVGWTGAALIVLLVLAIAAEWIGRQVT